MKYDFLFSIVMPLYNVEEYFEEAIDSVIEQTIGFKENIQVILVNDGSPDNIEELCIKYKEKYPDNIIYIKKENGGVSSARNAGMKYIRGKYVNFFDGDDRWETDAFKRAFDFFEQHYNELDIVDARVNYFGAREGFEHVLDYRFDKDKVVDLNKEYEQIQLMIGNSFMKGEAIKEMSFNETMPFIEDGLFGGELVLKKEKRGILPSVIYNYRRREAATSLTSNQYLNKFWFMDLPKSFFKRLIDLSIDRYGVVRGYIQYMIMYEMQWHRTSVGINETLDEQEKKQYCQMLKDTLQYIDDEIITGLVGMTRPWKLFFLDLKYGRHIVFDSKLDKKGMLRFHGLPIYNMKSWGRCNVCFIDIKGKDIKIEGFTDIDAVKGMFELYAVDSSNTYYKFELEHFVHRDLVAFTGETAIKSQRFKVNIPLKSGDKIKFVAKSKDGKKVRIKPAFLNYARLINEKGLNLGNSYYVNGKSLIKFENNYIRVFKKRFKSHLASEIRYMRSLSKDELGKETLLLRILYYLNKPFVKKPIWIISDRDYKAGDNGESLFKYIMSTPVSKDKKIYFLIDKEAEDHSRLRAMGKTLHQGTMKYYLKFLLSEKIISAHADGLVTNPFGGKGVFLKNLMDFKFVYLQHGVLPGDLSGWLNRFNKNIKLLVTTTKRERNEYITGNYYYDDEIVKLTGAPRHDDIHDTPKRKIAFLPTWRKNLAMAVTEGTRDRAHSDIFSKSNYRNFYNDLINDKRILEAMKNNNFSGEFFVHPSHINNTGDFTGNEYIKVGDGIADYPRLISESNMILTDYSSVTFDFGYLRKSVIYAQFDREEFFATHSYNSSYFDYEKDGFGPVCYDYESTVESIINAIENDCTNPDKYVKRCDDFFAFNDKMNSKRVLEALLHMDD